MPVYDLDKTQEWLNRTMAIRRDPPLRGGVRTDLRARRQTLSAVGVVVLVVLLLARLPIRQAVVAAAKPADVPVALPVTLQPQPVNAASPSEPQRDSLTEKWLASLHRSDNRPILDVMPQPFLPAAATMRSEGRVAPPAPIWLDGKP